MSARNVDLESTAFSNLDDTETWRVYSDWLQNVGDPRGELASLEMLRRDAFRSERAKLDEQIQEREQPYRDAWQSFAEAKGLTEVEPTFRRGFVYSVVGSLPQLEPVLDELFEREPIQRLELRDADAAGLERVCNRKPQWFERLRFLRLWGRVGTKGAQALSKVSLRRLVRLNLLGAGIGKGAGKHLAKLDAPELRALTLTSNKLDAEGLSALLESPTRSSWRELYLSCNPLEAEGLQKLAATTQLDGLEHLYICEVTDKFDGYEAILNSKTLAGLRTVELSNRGSWSSQPLLNRMKKRWGSGLRLR